MSGQPIATTRHIMMAIAILAGVAACSEDTVDSAQAPTPVSASGKNPAVPDCAAVGEAVGGSLLELHPIPYDADGDTQQGGLTCVWGTSESARAASEELVAPQDMARMGTVTAHIDFAATMGEDEARSANMVFDDERAKAVGGWVFARNNLDRSGRPGVMPPQVVVGTTVVYFGPVAIGREAAQIHALTNDWAIDAAVAVHRLLQSRD